MKGLFMDAVDGLSTVFHNAVRPTDRPVDVNEETGTITADDLPALLAGYDLCWTITRRCRPKPCGTART
jgi:hypothetical protein